MRRPATVRGRTALAATVVVAVALAAAGALFVLLLQRSLMRDVAATVQLRSDDVAAALAAGATPQTATGTAHDGLYVQLTDLTGAVVASSPTIPEGQRLVSDPSLRPGRQRKLSELSVGEDGQDFQVELRRLSTARGPELLYVAASLEPVEQSVATVVPQLLVGLPVLLGVVAVTTWVMAGLALHPVEAIRRQVAAISSRDLSARVPEPSTHDEVAQLARMMNQMLGRLETAAVRQRRFIADASHELRSPLTTLRAKTEVALAHPERADWPRMTAGVLCEIERLCRLVDDLLLLTRTSDAPRARTDHVAIADLVLDEAERLTAREAVTVEVVAPTGGSVRGDAGELSRLLRNLGDNAERHASRRVRLVVRPGVSDVVVDIEDDGNGIPAPERARVFERFTRLDEARSREDGGSGLGLALALELARAHGGQLTATDAPLGGARLRLRLPLARETADSRG